MAERQSRATHDTQPPQQVSWGELMHEALTMPGQLGNTYNRFYTYSFMNQILLCMQGVREPVNTYDRWKDMGRQVKKGSRAKAINRPLFRKELSDKGEEVTRLTGFKLVRCLFTASETVGEPLPEYEIPEWNEDRALGALSINRVAFEHLDGNTAGYSYDRNVAVSPVAKWPFKTLIHEVGHVELGHTTKDQEEAYRGHRGLAEFGAESTAYLVLNELGMQDAMDASESRGYIQHWLQGETPADHHIKAVFGTVDRVLKAGRQTLSAVVSE